MAPLPKLANGHIDKDAVRTMFMASPFYSWTEFAQSQKWDAVRTRGVVPYKLWVEEKRNVKQLEQAEILSAALFEHQGRYHQDVLKTLRMYPQSADAILGLANMKMQEIMRLREQAILPFPRNGTRQDQEAWQEARKAYEKLSDPAKLSFLASTVKQATEAKHKALLLDRYKIEDSVEVLIEQESMAASAAAGGGGAGQEAPSGRYTIKMIDGKAFSAEDLQRKMVNWYDRAPPPIDIPAPPELVEDAG